MPYFLPFLKHIPRLSFLFIIAHVLQKNDKIHSASLCTSHCDVSLSLERPTFRGFRLHPWCPNFIVAQPSGSDAPNFSINNSCQREDGHTPLKDLMGNVCQYCKILIFICQWSCFFFLFFLLVLLLLSICYFRKTLDGSTWPFVSANSSMPFCFAAVKSS